VIAALNVTVHAAETPLEALTGRYLPLLVQAAGAIGADWARFRSAPHVTAPQPGALTASTAASRLQVAGQVSGWRTHR
jgi:IclR family transcriptional regulator, pca regulon regulatory protein